MVFKKELSSRVLTLFIIICLALHFFEFPSVAYATGGNSVTLTSSSEDGGNQFTMTITSYEDAIVVQVHLDKRTSDWVNFKLNFERPNSSSPSMSKTFDKDSFEINGGEIVEKDDVTLTIAAARFYFTSSEIQSNQTGAFFSAKIPLLSTAASDGWDNSNPYSNITVTYTLFQGRESAYATIATLTEELEIPAGSGTCPNNWNNSSDDPPVTAPISSGSYKEEDYVVYWGYGGNVDGGITKDNTPAYNIQAKDGYVIDEILVDGDLYTPYTEYHGKSSYQWSGEAPNMGLLITFAYTVNFQRPANGTLSVSRDGIELESGDIVRGGEILTVKASPSDGYALSGSLAISGLEHIAGDTYRVIAENGEATPSISASFVYVDVSATVSDFPSLVSAVNAGKTEITLTNDITVAPGSVITGNGKPFTILGNGHTINLANETDGCGLKIWQNTHVTLKNVVLKSMCTIGTAVSLDNSATLELDGVTADGGGVTDTFFANTANESELKIYSLTVENLAADGHSLDVTSKTEIWPTGNIEIENFYVHSATGGDYPICEIHPVDDLDYRITKGTLSDASGTSYDLAQCLPDEGVFTVQARDLEYSLSITAAPIGEERLIVTVSDAKVEAGDTFTLTVYFENYVKNGISFWNFDVPYDTGIFEFVSVTDGEDYPAHINNQSNYPITYVFFSQLSFGYRRLWASGKVATLTFKVKSDAPDGNYPMSLTGLRDGSFVGTWKSDDPRLTINSGMVTVGEGFEIKDNVNSYQFQTWENDKGSIQPSRDEVVEGEQVTFNVHPSAGYMLTSLNVSYAVPNPNGTTGFKVETEDITRDWTFTVPSNVISTTINVTPVFQKPTDLNYWFIDASGNPLLPGEDGYIHVYPGAEIFLEEHNDRARSTDTFFYQSTSAPQEKETFISTYAVKLSRDEPLCVAGQKAGDVEDLYVTTSSIGNLSARFLADPNTDVGRRWNIDVQAKLLQENGTLADLPVDLRPDPPPHVESASHTSSRVPVTTNGASPNSRLEPGTMPFGYTIECANYVYTYKDHHTETGSYSKNAGIYDFTMPAADVEITLIYRKLETHPVYVTKPDHGDIYIRQALDVYGTEWSAWQKSYNGELKAFDGQQLQVKGELEDNWIIRTVTYDNPQEGKDSVTTSPYTGYMGSGDMHVTADVVQQVVETIQNQADLEALRAKVAEDPEYYQNIIVRLTEDITLTGEWEPIGTYQNPFYGIFDGGGHMISNLNINFAGSSKSTSEFNLNAPSTTYYLGLFGFVNGGELKDLTVEGQITCTGIEANGSLCIGGLTGTAWNASLTNCTNRVTIREGCWAGYTTNVGGLAGISYKSEFSGCRNYASIDNIGNPGMTAGGIVGTANYLTMTHCGNIGPIDTTGLGGENPAGYYNWGGCYGGLAGQTVYTTDIEQSFNRGNISGCTEAIGGLVGFANSTNARYTTTITDCYNTGVVTQQGDCITDKGSKQTLTAGGLVGTNMNGSSEIVYPLTLTNCYTTAENTSKQTSCFYWAELVSNFGDTDVTTIINCYGYSDLPDYQQLAAQLGENFVYNTDTGLPALAWESGSGTDITGSYKVTFSVTPANANANVALFYDAAHTNPVTGWVNGGTLTAGKTYFYAVTAENYFEETGQFDVVSWDVKRTVDLNPMATVIFNVNPTDAVVTVHHVDSEAYETGTSSGSGTWTFYLTPGKRYECSVSASGYTSQTMIVNAQEGRTILDTITLQAVGSSSGSGTESADRIKTITGGTTQGIENTISESGDYIIQRGATGTIYINTSDSVTLIGTGISAADCFKNLSIEYLVNNGQLTIENLYILDNEGKNDPNIVLPGVNIINFRGGTNTLDFQGENLLDTCGYVEEAGIHVPKGSSLTIGAGSSGTLYMYKFTQGSGIGGNAYEACGKITIAGGDIFIKGSKTGALIGGDATNTTNDDITITGGVLNMVNVAQGAAIGSSKAGKCAGNVFITGGSVTIITSFEGSAIGYGGDYYDKTTGVGGTLTVTGGSLKCVRTGNSLYENGDTVTQIVDDSLITASKGSLHLLEFDTEGNAVTVYNWDGKSIEAVGSPVYNSKNGITAQHLYKYTESETSTKGNWELLGSTEAERIEARSVYLYLDTTQKYLLDCGSKTYGVTWTGTEWDVQLLNDTTPEDKPAEPGSATEPGGTTVDTSTEVEEGVTSTIVEKDAIDAAIEQTGKDEYLVIDATVSDEDGDAMDINEANVTIPVESVVKAADNTAGIAVKSSVGNVTLSSTTLTAITAGADSEADVEINLKREDWTLSINVSVGGETVMHFAEKAKVVAEAASLTEDELDSESESAQVLVLLHADGSETTVRKSIVDNGMLYALLDGSAVLALRDKAIRFDDVGADEWYASTVAFASSHELFHGIGDNLFDPEGVMTRAMLVTVLHRLEDTPDAETLNSFVDIPSDYYTDAVNWASESNIVEGYGDGTFGPDDSVTREQIATILYRYMQYMDLDVSVQGDLDRFTDGGETHPWATDAMEWAIGAGLVEGKGNDILDPTGDATRAEVAALLQRLIGLMVM